MAAITIPDTLRTYFPQHLKPEQLWVHYNPQADSLTVYFNGAPTPSVWDDVDDHAFIGFSISDDTVVTGVKIEQFTTWLVISGQSSRVLEPA
jgi:hypothetical protein